jgi:hypothetical protein
MSLVSGPTFSQISTETVDTLNGVELICNKIRVGEETIPPIMQRFVKHRNAENGRLLVKQVNTNLLVLQAKFSIDGYSADYTYHITDALESYGLFGHNIYEHNGLVFDPEAKDPFVVSIATRVKFSFGLLGKLKSVKIKKGVYNAHNPFGKKDIICSF